MFDKIPTQVPSDSAAQPGDPFVMPALISTTRSAFCTLLAWNRPLLSSGVPHE